MGCITSKSASQSSLQRKRSSRRNMRQQEGSRPFKEVADQQRSTRREERAMAFEVLYSPQDLVDEEVSTVDDGSGEGQRRIEVSRHSISEHSMYQLQRSRSGVLSDGGSSFDRSLNQGETGTASSPRTFDLVSGDSDRRTIESDRRSSLNPDHLSVKLPIGLNSEQPSPNAQSPAAGSPRAIASPKLLTRRILEKEKQDEIERMRSSYVTFVVASPTELDRIADMSSSVTGGYSGTTPGQLPLMLEGGASVVSLPGAVEDREREHSTSTTNATVIAGQQQFWLGGSWTSFPNNSSIGGGSTSQQNTPALNPQVPNNSAPLVNILPNATPKLRGILASSRSESTDQQSPFTLADKPNWMQDPGASNSETTPSHLMLPSSECPPISQPGHAGSTPTRPSPEPSGAHSTSTTDVLTILMMPHQSPNPIGLLHYDKGEGLNSHKSYQAINFKERVKKMTLMEAQAFHERREAQRLRQLRMQRLFEQELAEYRRENDIRTDSDDELDSEDGDVREYSPREYP